MSEQYHETCGARPGKRFQACETCPQCGAACPKHGTIWRSFSVC